MVTAKVCGRSQKLPPRQGRGIAVHRSFLSYVAVVAHVAVGNDGQVTIPRLDMAIDCGTIVNPDRVRAQLDGAAIMSIGNALYGNITVKEGRVEQSNYTDYLVPRTDIIPETHVYFVENTHPPGGVGEPGVPPTAPGDLQRDLRRHRQADPGTASRSAAAEGLDISGGSYDSNHLVPNRCESCECCHP